MRARLSPQGGHRRRGKVVDAVRLTAEAAMVPFAALLSALSGIPDPRRSQGRRYPLAHLLLFSVLAVLAGATSYRGILSFIGVHRERLNATFGTRLRRAPAGNTLRNLFLALDPVDLETAFRRHARGLHEAVPRPGRPVLALAGKTLRRSFHPLAAQAAAQGPSAFASEAASSPGSGSPIPATRRCGSWCAPARRRWRSCAAPASTCSRSCSATAGSSAAAPPGPGRTRGGWASRASTIPPSSWSWWSTGRRSRTPGPGSSA